MRILRLLSVPPPPDRETIPPSSVRSCTRGISCRPCRGSGQSQAGLLLALTAGLFITACSAPDSGSLNPGGEIEHRAGFSSGQRPEPLEFS